MKPASSWWSSLALACWMLSCAKASIQQQQQQPSNILASPECATAQDTPFVYSNVAVAKDAVPEDSLSEDEQAEKYRRSYTVQMVGGPLEESDGESSDSLTRPSAISTAVMVHANATDAATASMSPHLEAEGSSIPPPHYHHHHRHQSAFFQETLLVEETMATMDIIICALVAAFVALLYRDIIETCG